MASFVKSDNDGYPETAAFMTACGLAWPRQAMITDLRYLANLWWLYKTGKRRGVPGRMFSERTLAARWSCSRHVVRSIWTDAAAWVDTAAPWARYPKTPWSDHLAASERPDGDQQNVDEPEQTGDQRPSSDHSPTEKVATRGGEQGTRTKNKDNTVSPPAATGQPSTGSKKSARVIPSDLLDAYNAYRAASGIKKSTRVLTAYKGQGQKLWGIHKEAGADAVGLFRWLATSQDQKAVFYRDGKFAAETVKRHLDTLLDLVDAKPSQTPHNANKAPANTNDTPGHLFMRAYRNARGQHPAWLDHVPSDEREHFLRAARHCKGLVMLKTMGTHPLDNKRALETFNQSFEATR